MDTWDVGRFTLQYRKKGDERGKGRKSASRYLCTARSRETPRAKGKRRLRERGRERERTLSALNARLASLPIVIIILVHRVRPARHLLLLPLARLAQLDLVHVDLLRVVRLCRHTRVEGGLKAGDEVRRDGVGELDVELDVEVAHLVMAVGGHALAFDALDIPWRKKKEKEGEKERGRREGESAGVVGEPEREG
jgi:hypothetical protein